jgi:CheY-like chemotaxis protein
MLAETRPGISPVFKILVVEDSSSDVLLIREALSETGYRYDITVVDCHLKADEIGAEKPFHLIVCDYCGDIDGGPDLVGRLRKTLPATPIIVLSDYTEVKPAYRAGANAFVNKAGELSEFFQKVHGIMHFGSDVAQLPPENWIG